MSQSDPPQSSQEEPTGFDFDQGEDVVMTFIIPEASKRKRTTFKDVSDRLARSDLSVEEVLAEMVLNCLILWPVADLREGRLNV